jgi:hypothetical protein
MPIDYKQYIPLISINNEILKTKNIDNAADFETYIENYLSEIMQASFGYNEIRNLYKRSGFSTIPNTLIRLMDSAA